jgi:DNA-binding MarR family transcriptional regulator
MAKTKLRLDAFLPFRLSVASNAVSRLIARSYETRYGLKVAEWRLIAVLAETDGLTQQAIVERTVMDKVTVSRAVQGLMERRLAQRAPNPKDARSHMVSLTSEGKALHAEVAPIALATERRLIEGLTAGEVAELERLLLWVERRSEELAD